MHDTNFLVKISVNLFPGHTAWMKPSKFVCVCGGGILIMSHNGTNKAFCNYPNYLVMQVKLQCLTLARQQQQNLTVIKIKTA